LLISFIKNGEVGRRAARRHVDKDLGSELEGKRDPGQFLDP
jgi:hypothetical protein